MSKMLGRVYGVLGVKSVMANWNADFSGYPKSLGCGEVFYGSDKALKYAIKSVWNSEDDKKVLYIKSMKTLEKGGAVKLQPRSLKERYEQVFDVKDLKNQNNILEVLKNLFSATDVKNFGATFAESGANISIPGAVQITQGLNKYDGHYAEEEQILSPFRDATDKGEAKDAMQTTIGTRIISNEAHYFYSFSINPTAYKSFEEMGATEGYTFEDYQCFKNTALIAATALDTGSKTGCENEFGIFVETDDMLFLSDLAQYVTFNKNEEGKDFIDITDLVKILEDVSDRISSVEIYYNPYTTELIGTMEKAKFINIFTRKEV